MRTLIAVRSSHDILHHSVDEAGRQGNIDITCNAHILTGSGKEELNNTMKPYWNGRDRDHRLALVMRGVALFAGVYQFFFGEMIIGIAILSTVGAISLPAIATRGNIQALPIEFELIFITMVMLQFVIGETLDFYLIIPHYDRFVHFSLPLFVGFISFMIAYTLHEIGALKLPTLPLMLAIIFMTLGVGALWEIGEYLSDVYLHPQFAFIPQLQGSGGRSALSDTMQDLIIDFVGGIIGALLGLRYINSKSSNVKARVLRIVKVVSSNFKTMN